MLKCRLVRLAILSAVTLSIDSAYAQNQLVTGFYQIISGTYLECCGFGGNDFAFALPNQRQSFVKLTVNPQSNLASMTFLADDMHTVFSTIPCPPSGAINFDFAFGFLFSDQIFFHVDPGPPPYQMYWNYTVSNSALGLRINGLLGTVQSACADVPTRFTHSNVVAVLLPGPTLNFLEFSTNRVARLFLQGHAGWTYVIEASTDLVSWTPVGTNVMDYNPCPNCPFFIFEDPASTNLPRRYYRAFELP